MMPKEAIILAGGLGTRLRRVVSDRPKPLAPVAGRPFLHWLLDGLAQQGVQRVVLAIGYMGWAIRDAIGESHSGMDIVYALEDNPLGTGGAVWAALALCGGERIFVTNGDTWIGASLPAIAVQAPRADMVVTVRPVPDRARYGSVLLEDDRIVGIEEKGRTGPGLVNAGLYLLRRDLVGRLSMPSAFSLEHELLARSSVIDIRAHRTDATFIDIGTPDDFFAAQELLPRWTIGQPVE